MSELNFTNFKYKNKALNLDSIKESTHQKTCICFCGHFQEFFFELWCGGVMKTAFPFTAGTLAFKNLC